MSDLCALIKCNIMIQALEGDCRTCSGAGGEEGRFEAADACGSCCTSWLPPFLLPRPPLHPSSSESNLPFRYTSQLSLLPPSTPVIISPLADSLFQPPPLPLPPPLTIAVAAAAAPTHATCTPLSHALRCSRCKVPVSSTVAAASSASQPTAAYIDYRTISAAAASALSLLHSIAGACSSSARELASGCSYDCCAAAAILNFGSKNSTSAAHGATLQLQSSMLHAGQSSLTMRAATADDDEGADSDGEGVGVITMPCSSDSACIITGAATLKHRS